MLSLSIAPDICGARAGFAQHLVLDHPEVAHRLVCIDMPYLAAEDMGFPMDAAGGVSHEWHTRWHDVALPVSTVILLYPCRRPVLPSLWADPRRRGCQAGSGTICIPFAPPAPQTTIPT